MKVSTKGRYALRLMVNLAKNAQIGPVSLTDISEREGISPKYLEQITLPLTRAKLLKSVRGIRGGYTLTKKPEEYSIKEILYVTEMTLAPVTCLETAKNTCPRKNDCHTLKLWEGLGKVVDEYLSSITLADLLK